MNEYNYASQGADYRVDYDPDLIAERPLQRRQRNERINDNSRDRGSDETDNGAKTSARRETTAPPKERNTRDTTARKRESKPRRAKRPWKEAGIVKFLCDKRFHAVVGVALVFLAVYISVAAISFLRSGSEDQSVVSSMSVSQIVQTGTNVENSAGPVGARLAQSVIVEGLGLGSVALVIYLGLVGLSLMGFRKTGFWSLTFKSLLVAIAISMVLGLISLWLGLEFNLGGYHGHYINAAIIGYLDWIGASLIGLLLIISVFYVYINDILKLYNRYRAMRNAHKAKAEQARMELEESREKVRRAMAEADRDENEPQPEAETATSEKSHPVSLGFEDTPADNDEDMYAINADTPRTPIQPAYQHIHVAEQGLWRNEAQNEAYNHNDAYNREDETPDTAPLTATTAEPQVNHHTQIYHEDKVYHEDKAAGYSQPTTTTVRQEPEPEPQPTEAPVAVEKTEKNNALEMPALEVVTNSIEVAKSENTSSYDPTAELSRYRMPGLDLLRDVPVKANSVDLEEQEENKERITKTLNDYGIAISHIQATVGPTVTLYEIIPAEGVRIAKIKRLEDDIAMSLAALGIRIIAPIPGKGTIGIEVPNKDPQTVSIRSILGSKKFQECKQQLPMAMGATISNEVYIADLCKMPHLLVAGATGMGKSVGLNTIIASLLYKKHPAELKFVLIDPKMVEFSLYSVLERHYLAKLPDEEEAVVTSMDKVLATLNSLCVEMDQRYMLLRDANVRSITEYNERFVEKRLNPEKGHRYLPYIVMIVDEFADLIMTAGKEVEKPIARIAQKARAVGMHMIIATQRPSTNVITGIIKANFPGRIAFRVSQMVDSKTILDRTGANQLIGRGDMLFSHNGSLDRVQCAFIDTPEVQAICDHIDAQAGYEHAYYLPEPIIEADPSAAGSLTDRDPLFDEAAEIVVTTGVASTSSLQRRYSIGYNRAGKIMDQLEAAGIVGPSQGGKPRQVLIDQMQLGSIIRSFE